MQAAGKGGATGAVGRVGAAARHGPRGPAPAAGFTLDAAVPAGAGVAPSAAVAVAATESLLVLQAAGGAAAREKAAVQTRAAAVLDGLGALQHALLMGGGGAVARGRLQALADALAAAGPAQDPALAEIQAAIALRAQIELARHEWAGRG